MVQAGAVSLNVSGLKTLRRLASGCPVWLLEVKTVLTTEALGQILTYSVLFAQQYAQLPVQGIGIVAGVDDPDVRVACDKYGVRVFIRGENF